MNQENMNMTDTIGNYESVNGCLHCEAAIGF